MYHVVLVVLDASLPTQTTTIAIAAASSTSTVFSSLVVKLLCRYFMFVIVSRCSHNPPPLSILFLSVQGTRSDIKHRLPLYPSSPTLYSGNTSLPPWIHIYRSSKSTSRRTQAAAVAYMFPQYFGMANKINVILRNVTACNRCSKLQSTMLEVSCPPTFMEAIDSNTDLFEGKVALVCDGGIDHIIPSTPPPNKASISYIFNVLHSS